MYYKKIGNYEELEKEERYIEAIKALIEEVEYNYDRFKKKYGDDKKVEDLYNTIASCRVHKKLSSLAQKRVLCYIKENKEKLKSYFNTYEKGMER